MQHTCTWSIQKLKEFFFGTTAPHRVAGPRLSIKPTRLQVPLQHAAPLASTSPLSPSSLLPPLSLSLSLLFNHVTVKMQSRSVASAAGRKNRTYGRGCVAPLPQLSRPECIHKEIGAWHRMPVVFHGVQAEPVGLAR